MSVLCCRMLRTMPGIKQLHGPQNCQSKWQEYICMFCKICVPLWFCLLSVFATLSVQSFISHLWHRTHGIFRLRLVRSEVNCAIGDLASLSIPSLLCSFIAFASSVPKYKAISTHLIIVVWKFSRFSILWFIPPHPKFQDHIQQLDTKMLPVSVRGAAVLHHQQAPWRRTCWQMLEDPMSSMEWVMRHHERKTFKWRLSSSRNEKVIAVHFSKGGWANT